MQPRPLPAETRSATNILTFIYFGPALCFFLVYSTTTVWQFVINEYVMLYLSLRAIIVLGLNSITLICCTTVGFSALTLLVGRQQEHPPVKIEWWGVGVVISLDRGADFLHMVHLMPQHPRTPSSLVSLKSRAVSPFWCRLTQVVAEKRSLNRCSTVLEYTHFEYMDRQVDTRPMH